MEKTTYRVYRNSICIARYVTTTRNCEDMIEQIRSMYELPMRPMDIDKVVINIERINNDGRTKVYSNTNPLHTKLYPTLLKTITWQK